MRNYIDHYTTTKVKIHGKWYIAKPLNYFTIKRFVHAFHVLTGRAIAVYFYEDDI